MTDEIDIGQKLLFNHRLPQPLHGRPVLVRRELKLELPTRHNDSAKKFITNANLCFICVVSILFSIYNL